MCDIQLQKLLFSATLSHDPEKLNQLRLFQPLLFTSVVKRQQSDTVPSKSRTPQSEMTATYEEWLSVVIITHHVCYCYLSLMLSVVIKFVIMSVFVTCIFLHCCLLLLLVNDTG